MPSPDAYRFYKVPSLRGVWFRNAFGHMGQAESLEEWFDPVRLGPDYLPHGFSWGRDQKDDPGV